MASKIGVVNDALRIIGASRVTGLTGATKAEALANDAWDTVWRTELEAHPWVFAVTRANVPASADVPLGPYEAAYRLPADCVAVVDCPALDRRMWSKEVVSGAASVVTRCRVSGPLMLRYITSDIDVSRWPETFARAVAAKLAVSLCEPITQSNTKLEVAFAQYDDAIRTARRTDAIQMPPAEQPVDDWLLARL